MNNRRKSPKFRSVFYISPAKLKRLEGRICRVKTTVKFYGAMGYDSQLRLDSGKGDHIGLTKESLDKYLKIIIGERKLWYHVEKWSIMPL